MSAGAFEDDGDVVIEMDLLPPRWADISDEVTELLADVAKKSQKLEKLHQKHVLPGFDDEEAKQREEDEIEDLTQEITKGFHKCQNAIQRIEYMVRESRQQGGISKGEEVMAKNIQISLAGRVQEASAGFRKKQAAYLKSELTYSKSCCSKSNCSKYLMHLLTPDCRTPRTKRNELPPDGTSCPQIPRLHRPLAHGIRRRQSVLTISPPTNLTKTAHLQRCSNNAPRARNQRHSPRHHRARRHLQRATEHGHRPRHDAGPDRLQCGEDGYGCQGGGQGVNGCNGIPEEDDEAEDHSAVDPAGGWHVYFVVGEAEEA